MEKRITLFDPFNKRSMLFAALALVLQFFVYLVPTFFMPRMHLYDITLPIDALIPFWPVFVIPYVLVFAEWGYCYLLAPLLPGERFGRYAAALVIGLCLTFVIYFAFPTTYVRPETENGGFFTRVMAFLFGLDQPSRCLPSMHCFLGWLNWRLVAGEARVPKWMRGTMLFWALLTLPTTLFVKQHVIVDVPAGVLLAELSWFAAGKTKLPALLRGKFEALSQKLNLG